MSLTNGYAPGVDFIRDLDFGESGERVVADLLGIEVNDGVEVKRSRIPDAKFYVETHQQPKKSGPYKPSGINTTTAEWWVFVKPGSVFLIVSAELLRGAIQRGCGRYIETDPNADNDNPTKGRLVDIHTIYGLGGRLERVAS